MQNLVVQIRKCYALGINGGLFLGLTTYINLYVFPCTQSTFLVTEPH